MPNGLLLLTLRKEKFSGKNYETGTCRTNSIGFGNLDYSFSRSYNLKAAELVRLLNKGLYYNELINTEDMEKIQNALVKAIIDKYQDGIVQNNPYRGLRL